MPTWLTMAVSSVLLVPFVIGLAVILREVWRWLCRIADRTLGKDDDQDVS